MVRCGARRCGTVRYCAVGYGTVRCGVVRNFAARGVGFGGYNTLALGDSFFVNKREF